jgi:transcriptional regulator with XRE-family HTH domain
VSIIPPTSLKHLRQTNRWPIEWVASQIGVSAKTLSAWESEDVQIDLAPLLGLAALFNVAVGEIALPPTQRLVQANRYIVLLKARCIMGDPEQWTAKPAQWQDPEGVRNPSSAASGALFALVNGIRDGTHVVTAPTATEAMDKVELLMSFTPGV